MREAVTAWPNGSKIAVMVTVLYESWSEGQVPAHSPMVLAAPMHPGTPDLQGISWAEYGGETGVWRLLEQLDQHKIKSTFCTTASTVERYPESIAAAYASGHEIAAHSYTQDMLLPYLEPEQEAALIRKCTDIISGAIGERPTGWISPRATATRHTADFLIDAGYRWHGDYNDADLPYVIRRGNRELVALMHSDFTDIRAIRGSPRDFLHVHRDIFDFLYKSERPEIINLSIHAHFGGRPLMAAMFAQILEYYCSFEHVWFARHDELANWVLRQKAGIARHTAPSAVDQPAQA
jgi:peptidoglycan/xylan/chitin deacetylase (PgdA/CDA1 family)